MKSTLMLSFVLLACNLLAVPTVTVTSVAEDAQKREITVTYTLSGAPAIVTCDILDNGQLLDEKAYGFVCGDIHRQIETDGTYSFRWRPNGKAGELFASAQLTFKVDAWTLDAPPNYMVVGLAETNRIAYYASTNAFPGGLLRNTYYRTDAIVMRYVKAKGVTTWLGAWDSDQNVSLENGAEADETRYQATFTNDFWMSVFEVTQAQSELVRGTTSGGKWDSADSNLLYRAMRPATLISYNDLRDKNSTSCFYPQAPHADSWLGRLRKMAPFAFDLPCDAQWEYACRAGTDIGYWNDGSPMKPVGQTLGHDSYVYRTDATLPGRWMGNGGAKSVDQQKPVNYYGWRKVAWSNDEMMTLSADECRTALCGSYAPNAWGLYDMHGNAFEYVNDYAASDAAIWKTLAGKPNISPTDPTKQYDGSDPVCSAGYEGNPKAFRRLMKGGEYNRGLMECRSAARTSQTASGAYACNGIRLIINL